MKKTIITLSLLLASLTFGTINRAAASADDIAVIDIHRVISASSQVKALEQAQAVKNKELAEFIKNAEADISKQKNDEKKKEVAEKYEKQLNERRITDSKEYITKLREIDANISAQVGEQAKKMGYKVVFPKDAVVFGGDDITEAVLKVIK